MKKYILTISITLNALSFVFIATHLYYKHNLFRLFGKQENSKTLYPSNRISYLHNRDRLYNSLPNDTNEIVFLGDSHTQFFPLDEVFKNLKIKNRGIGSDVAKGIYYRLNEAIESRPKKMFIMVGINDLNNGYPVDTIMKYYELIIKTIREQSPNTIVYVQSVIPVAKNSFYKNNNLEKLNNDIYTLAATHKLHFIDVYSKFQNNGFIDSSLVVDDGLHLNGKGYALWAGILKEYL